MKFLLVTMVKKEINMVHQDVLCAKKLEETMHHLFVEYPYVKEVWSEVVKMTRVNADWREVSR